MTQGSIVTIGEVDNNSLLNQAIEALHKRLMGRIIFDIVIPVLDRLELGNEAVGNTILSTVNRLLTSFTSQVSYLQSLGRVILAALQGLDVGFLVRRMYARILQNEEASDRLDAT